MGTVEQRVRTHIKSAVTLRTFAKRAPFVVRDLDNAGVILLLGTKRAYTRLSWACLEGIPGFLRNKGWVTIGGSRRVEGDPGTLDEYLKSWIKRDIANYVTSLLAHAGIVDVDVGPPARVRLREES
ncbi:MAG: hypothetical protein MUP15_04020 [Dehalococcoidia bacterium]|nr:hypothetical protein [Dehalococcoidia bacterium]